MLKICWFTYHIQFSTRKAKRTSRQIHNSIPNACLSIQDRVTACPMKGGRNRDKWQNRVSLFVFNFDVNAWRNCNIITNDSLSMMQIRCNTLPYVIIRHHLRCCHTLSKVSVIKEGGKSGSCQCCPNSWDDGEDDSHGVIKTKEIHLPENTDRVVWETGQQIYSSDSKAERQRK